MKTNIFLLTIVLFLLLGITEITFRVFFPYYLSPFIYDSILGFRLRQGEYIVDFSGEFIKKYANADGFADNEWDQNSKHQIVLLGDSMVQANQVTNEEDFETLLETFTGKEVLNFGMSGNSLTQEYLTLKHFALRYDPEMVIIVAYPSNDITESHPNLRTSSLPSLFPYIVFDPEERFIEPINPRYGFPISFLREHFHSYRWAAGRFHTFKNRAFQKDKKNLIKREDVQWVKDFPPQSNEKNWQQVWEIIEELYRRIAGFLHEKELLVVILPDKGRRVDDNAVRLMEILDRLSIAYLDIRDSVTDDMFLENDPHLNKSGHRFVAELIAATLLK